ncbi:MAG TPA: dihydroorotate dehydrogenase electron transfer subunit [Dehalococcoidia bacterium]|nr:dihydroorotate dehydrogenase electron transfer subunit [Dehalococcoidia bacterium]
MKRIDATIVSSEELWDGAFFLWVRAPEIATVARAGQYVMVRCGEGCDMPLRRPLSIHRVSRDGSIAFLFAVVGRGTEWLAQRSKGDSLDLFGPLGRGFEVLPASGNLLLIAGGMGIAPLVALADQAVESDRSVTLLIGYRTASQIYPQSLLPSGIETVVATEDGSLGTKGMVTDLLPEYIADTDQVFACGPLPMYKKMAEMTDITNGKPVQVLLETVLGCGVGACLGCTIETLNGNRRVCKDGPVFELKEVVWDKIIAPAASGGIDNANLV